jgi:three-Cys-motif partner protein
MPRIVGPWTKDKLKIIHDYLPAYLTATTRAIDRIYVDAFAGPGRNVIRGTQEVIDGSPLIAMKATASNGSKFTRLFFIESDPSCVEELKELTSQDSRCEVIEGDVNQQLPSLMHRINRRAPTFVLLDTAGIEPNWTTVAAIAPWQVELLINFPLGMSILRNLDSLKTVSYFGTQECLPILRGSSTRRTRLLLDLYRENLKSLGFQYATELERLIKTPSNKRLYYLTFASKVNIGKRIMDAVFNQPDSAGQQRLGL